MLSRLFDIEIIQFIAMTVSLALAILFMLMNVPKTEYAKKLTRAKTVIATNYLIGAFLFGYSLNHIGIPGYEEFSALIMLIITAFSSIMMSYSLINLIQPRFMDSSRFVISIFCLFAFSAILIETFFMDNRAIHTWALVAGITVFMLADCFLIIIFDRAYKRALSVLEKYYDEDEDHKLKWIRFCYILTMLTTMFILVYMIIPKWLIKVYISFYILYLIYFAGNFISFLGSHKLVLDAFGHNALTQTSKKRKAKKKLKPAGAGADDLANGVAEGSGADDEEAEILEEFSSIEKALKKWVDGKRYREYDKSREETAHDMGTTREMLQMYFNERIGQDFRSWRTELRIKEAKELLLEKQDTSINLIGEMAGFSDRSNFHRQFTKLVGCSPKRWRDTGGHPEL